MTRHYATTAHAAYLPQLRVLHASMRRHCAPFVLHVLAEGREVFEWCHDQPDVAGTLVDALLTRHPTLARDRLPGPPRTGNELACTWRWRFVADLVATLRAPILAVDADIMFWSSPDPMFAEIWDARCAVSPHGFAQASAGLPGVTMESHRRYGLFNGGWSYWADPRAARRMAELARECSRATDHRWPDGRTTWGDQGALELVQEEFGAHVIRHRGVNVGPWNVNTQPLEERDGVLHFGDRPLVSYHFSSLRWRADGSIEQLAYPEYGVTAEHQRLLYDPYLKAVHA